MHVPYGIVGHAESFCPDSVHDAEIPEPVKEAKSFGIANTGRKMTRRNLLCEELVCALFNGTHALAFGAAVLNYHTTSLLQK